MAKIKHPIKELWESDKKPNYLEVSKTKDSSVKIVKFIKPKSKNKKK